MCIAIAGKITHIDGMNAKVDIEGNVLDVNITLVSAQPGDYVLVHAGCAIEIIKEDTALEIINLYKLLEEAANNE